MPGGMFRGLPFIAAALAVAGCDIPAARSSVDMAPPEARSAIPPIPPGRYCGGIFDKGQTQIAADPDSCSILGWSPETRSYSVAYSVPAENNAILYAASEIRPGVVLLQTEVPEAEHAPYQLSIYVVRGGAMTFGMAFASDWTENVIARHPRVEFGSKDDHPYIAGGDRADISVFLLDVVSNHFRGALSDGETLQLLVRDQTGSSEHEPDARQALDIDALREHIKALIRAAPAGQAEGRNP